MNLARKKLSRLQQTKLKSLKTKYQKTNRFTDFLAVLNFIDSIGHISTHVGEVKVNAEEN